MATVEFNTREYEFSHGRKPRGYGSWAFFFTRSHDLENCMWVHGATYAEAKRQVRAEIPKGARGLGPKAGTFTGTVYVGS